MHFETSRQEYERALEDVGIQPDWSVLDAGCDGGSLLPLIQKRVGETGSVAALDLAPENIETARASVSASVTDCHASVGNVLDLPYADATFDCAWSANVVQYLTAEESVRAASEAQRVLKPGGVYAIKEVDSTILQMQPLDYGVFARLMDARTKGFRKKGTLGTDCGSLLPFMLQEAGWTILSKKAWMAALGTDQPADARLSP